MLPVALTTYHYLELTTTNAPPSSTALLYTLIARLAHLATLTSYHYKLLEIGEQKHLFKAVVSNSIGKWLVLSSATTAMLYVIVPYKLD